MNDFMHSSAENSSKINDGLKEKIENNVLTHPIYEENYAAIEQVTDSPKTSGSSNDNRLPHEDNAESKNAVTKNGNENADNSTETGGNQAVSNVDVGKEPKQKPREKKGSLRRNFSFGSFRQKFKKQHSRSYSESPAANNRRIESSDSSSLLRFLKSETTAGDDSPLSPTSPESDEVFEESKLSKSTTSPFPLRSRLRHTRTLPKLLPSSRTDIQESSDANSREDKMKAVQIWQNKACHHTCTLLSFSYTL